MTCIILIIMKYGTIISATVHSTNPDAVTLYIFMVLSVLPLLLSISIYRNNSSRAMKFFMRVSASPYAQRLFAYMLVLLVIAFHFTYYSAFPYDFGIMFSTLILIYLMSSERTLKLIGKIRNKKKCLINIFLFTLLTSACPHRLPVATTLAYITVAICLYPSRNTDLVYHQARLSYDNENDFIEAYFK